MVLEKTLESPLDWKEIKIRRSRQEEKDTTVDEMVLWHH